MLEMLINPKKAERKSWELFFIGLLYASLSIALVNWIFSKDVVMMSYNSILIITFTTMFSIPFMYFLIKLEEEKDIGIREERRLIKEHSKAIFALLWLFLGFVVAFSVLYIIMPKNVAFNNFEAQLKQYCAINYGNIEECVKEYGLKTTKTITARASASSPWNHFFSILINNIYVLIFVLIFSLAFGAGAIFILAWNASVIAVAIGIFTKAKLLHLHVGMMRYMFHGLPEIAAYFFAALAGGIISIAVIKHEIGRGKFLHVIRDSLDLIIVAFAILIFAALLEVFVTPLLF